MFHWRAFFLCTAMTFVLSVIFARDIMITLPLFNRTVREAALRAIDQLQESAYWASLVHLQHITHEDDRICFDWLYTYQTRTQTLPPVSIQTCV